MQLERQNKAVWNFLDYREFLRAFYERKKRETKGRFSYRIFSVKTGVASPNYLKLIIDGSRNLTPAHARRVAEFCGLSEKERDYFLTLIRWNQAGKKDSTSELWSQVLKKRALVKALELSTAQLSVLSDHLTVAVFELLNLEPSPRTVDDLVDRLRERVPPERVMESLEQLIKAGVIKKNNNGYKIVQKTLRTTEDLPSTSIKEYHRQTNEIGIMALKTIPVGEREFISTTVALKKEDLPRFKEYIRELRNLFLSEAENTSSPDAVYQLNIQFFPLTINPKERQ